ncbi:MAG TPA: glycerate kinase [Streptosporangiaceae bacterium]|nr:glycerate kinase [Streptosporangiaceae bacterium]
MRVVVAPDKFKGSASAEEVAAALAAGLRRARPDADIVLLPVADGGDGTIAAALSAGFEPVSCLADGPVGEPVETGFAFQASARTAGGSGGSSPLASTAVVELADVTGLRLLPGPKAPLTASTYGVGQVMAAALDHGASTIVLGIGGSASTDGGAGMLQALGVVLTGPDGESLARGGAALAGLARIDASGLDARIAAGRCSVLVASDVDNPLLGPTGAAAVFGPQKGASPADVMLLDHALARWAELTAQVTGTDLARAPGAGAAGGTGFGALAYLGARLVPGVELVLDLIGFDAAVVGADLVITGEGSLDEQSLSGKAPVGVARAAGWAGVPVVAVAGQLSLTPDQLRDAGFAAGYSLADLEPDHAVSMTRAFELLEQIGFQVAADHVAR